MHLTSKSFRLMEKICCGILGGGGGDLYFNEKNNSQMLEHRGGWIMVLVYAVGVGGKDFSIG